MPTVLQVTMNSIEIDDVEIAVPAMEVWSVFGMETSDRIM